MDINFNKSTNITWKPDNTLEVASSNGHVSKITGVSVIVACLYQTVTLSNYQGSVVI